MKKNDIKPRAKVRAKDIESEQEHSGQITGVETSGFRVKWEHEQDETFHLFENKEYELMTLI
jgi:hypothetical protein